MIRTATGRGVYRVATIAGMARKKKRPKRPSGMDAETFRALMAAAGKSQGETAELLGVSLRSVNRWAAGKGNISPPVAAAIRAKLPKS